ncbi:hypothetical protein GCM10010297_11310 [Streptomyces malachitofuscus]|nr:hypothetical protein GCM10010297_11310 [Streptomyces malachitofuscus]
MGADPAPTTVTANAPEDGAQGRIRAQRAVTDTLTGPERGDDRVVAAEDAAAQDTGSDDLRTTATTAVLLLGLTVLVAVAGVATSVWPSVCRNPGWWSVSPRRAPPSPSPWGSSRRSSSPSSW